MEEIKNGLVYENGELYYYLDGQLDHAGIIQVNEDIYYINSEGKAVKGQHIVHGVMTNGLVKKGTYTFGEDYKLIKNSYIAPKKKRKKKSKRTSSSATKRKTKEGLFSSFRKHKLAGACAILVAILLIATLWYIEGNDISRGTAPQQEETQPAQEGILEIPAFEEDVLLCSKAAKQEYDGEITLKRALEAGGPYRPLYFEYRLKNTDGSLLLSEKESLENAREFLLTQDKNRIAIDNLKVDTTYYFKVTAGEQERLGSFHTAPSTRFISIPGLENTRDIGGYQNLDGKKVKQGLLIRGTELDGLVNASFFIPSDEVERVQDEFGFVYDLDLREPSIYNGTYASRLDVNHSFYDSPMYGTIFSQGNYASLKRIFSDLAKQENYPMYLHCTWGRDRTGTIVFLLQGILNMSEEDMKREYDLTGYMDESFLDDSKMDIIIAGLEPYAGDSLQEKIVSFLTVDVGVTEEEIASIREIFLEA